MDNTLLIFVFIHAFVYVEPLPTKENSLKDVIFGNTCNFPPRYIGDESYEQKLQPCSQPTNAVLEMICGNIRLESNCYLAEIKEMPSTNVTLKLFSEKLDNPDLKATHLTELCQYMERLPWTQENTCQNLCGGDAFFICDLFVAMDKVLRDLFVNEVQNYTRLDSFIHPGRLKFLYPYPPIGSLHNPSMLAKCNSPPQDDITKDLCTVMAEVAIKYVSARREVRLLEEEFVRNVSSDWNPCAGISRFSSFSTSPEFTSLVKNCLQVCKDSLMGVCKTIYLGLEKYQRDTTRKQPSSVLESGAKTEGLPPSGEETGAKTVELPPSGEETGAKTVELPPSGVETGAKTVEQPPSGGETGAKTVEQPPSGGETGAKTVEQPPSGEETGAKTVELPPSGGETGAETAEQPPSGVETGAKTVELPPSGVKTGAETVEQPPSGEETGAKTVELPPSGGKTGAETAEQPPSGVETGAKTVELPPSGVKTGAETVEQPPSGEETGAKTVELPPSGVETGAETVEQPPSGEETGAKTVELPPSGVETGAETVEQPPSAEETGTKTIEQPPSGGETGAETVEQPASVLESGAETVELPPSGVETGAKTVGLQPSGVETGAETVEQPPSGEETGAKTVELQPSGVETGAETVEQPPSGEETGAKTVGLQPSGVETGAETVEQPPSVGETRTEAPVAYQKSTSPDYDYNYYDDDDDYDLLEDLTDDLREPLPLADQLDKSDQREESRKPEKTKLDRTVYMNDDEVDESSGSHFMAYFLVFVVLSIAGYIIFHNKQKIIALVIEGKTAKGSRRPSTKDYKQLKTEDVMPSLEKSAYSKDYVF